MAKGTYTIHHRKPVSRGGNNDNENMVKVPKSHHKAWHALFDNYGADQILQNLQEYWNFYSGGDHTYEAKQIGTSTLKSMLDLYQNDLSMDEVVKIKKYYSNIADGCVDVRPGSSCLEASNCLKSFLS